MGGSFVNKKTSLAALALLLALITAFFAGCGGGVLSDTSQQGDDIGASSDPFGDGGNSGTGQNGAEDVGSDTREDRELSYYDGASFVVLANAEGNGRDIFSAEDSLPDEYDSLVRKRNDALEQKLGIVIVGKSVTDVADHIKETNSSDNAPDLVYASGGEGMSEMMMYGCLEDLYKYTKNSSTEVGVSVSGVRQLSVYGKLYMLTGASVRSSVESTAVLFYDTRYFSEIGYEDGYLSELVGDGAWTYDALCRLIKEAETVLDKDSISLLGGEDESLYLIWKGMGARTVDKGTGDTPTVSVYSSKNVYYFEKASALGQNFDKDAQLSESLFYISSLSSGLSAVKNVGVLPIPTYNEDAGYTCVLDFNSTYFTAIPTGAQKKGMSLDFLSVYYSLNVNDFYSLLLRQNDGIDADVFDIILRSRYFDFLDMYGVGHIVSSAFDSQSSKGDFDKLLRERAKFASEVLDIALKQTVGHS